MITPLNPGTTLALASSGNALVMFLFAAMAYRAHQKRPSELSYAYLLFVFFTAVAFVFYAGYAYLDFRPQVVNWGDAVGGPFLYLAAAYMAEFVWYYFLRKPSRLPFWFFIIIAIMHIVLHAMHYLSGVDTYAWIVLLLAASIGLFYLVAGVAFWWHGFGHSAVRHQSWLLGSAFIIATVFGMWTNFLTNPLQIVVVNLVSTAGFGLGLVAVLSPSSKTIKTV